MTNGLHLYVRQIMGIIYVTWGKKETNEVCKNKIQMKKGIFFKKKKRKGNDSQNDPETRFLSPDPISIRGYSDQSVCSL